jgi:hypothetical protein
MPEKVGKDQGVEAALARGARLGALPGGEEAYPPCATTEVDLAAAVREAL